MTHARDAGLAARLGGGERSAHRPAAEADRGVRDSELDLRDA